MAFDGNGRLHWYASVNGTGLSYLYTIDPVTRFAKNLGNIGPNAASGIAFDGSGNMITTGNSGGTIYSIDFTSPNLAGTVVGNVSPRVYDLGSCALPNFNADLVAVKTVRNVTKGQNPATIAQSGDVLEYTIIISNVGNLMTTDATFIDAIPTGTTYLASSTTLNGNSVADDGGNMPYVTTREINSDSQPSGVVTTGSAATIVFQVTVNSGLLPAQISNTGTTTFPIVAGGTTVIQSNNSNVVNTPTCSPIAPTISAITQPSCLVANGSFTITNYDAAYTYNFSPSVGVIQSGANVTAPAGNYSVSGTFGPCTSAPVNVVINAQPATPAVPTLSTTAATCLSAGSTTITNYNNALTYTFSPAGPSVGAGGLVSGATAGTSYTVTAGNGTCTSGSSSSFSNDAILPTPAVPTLSTTAATCLAAGSTTITNYNNALTYTFSPAGPSVGAGGLVSGATAGTSYTVTAGNGTCTSGSSSSFSNDAILPTPAVPTLSTTAATCLAAGSTTITNYNNALTYTFSPAGPSVGAGGLVSGATAGTSYTVTAGNTDLYFRTIIII